MLELKKSVFEHMKQRPWFVCSLFFKSMWRSDSVAQARFAQFAQTSELKSLQLQFILFVFFWGRFTSPKQLSSWNLSPWTEWNSQKPSWKKTTTTTIYPVAHQRNQLFFLPFLNNFSIFYFLSKQKQLKPCVAEAWVPVCRWSILLGQLISCCSHTQPCMTGPLKGQLVNRGSLALPEQLGRPGLVCQRGRSQQALRWFWSPQFFIFFFCNWCN